jgi:hypothetical protein
MPCTLLGGPSRRPFDARRRCRTTQSRRCAASVNCCGRCYFRSEWRRWRCRGSCSVTSSTGSRGCDHQTQPHADALEGCNGRRPRVELRPEYVLGVPQSGRTARGGVPAPRGGRHDGRKPCLRRRKGIIPVQRRGWTGSNCPSGLGFRGARSLRCLQLVAAARLRVSPEGTGNEVSAYSHQRERSGGTLENGSKLFLALTTSPHEAQKARHGRSQSFPRRRAIACIVRPCSGLVALPGCTSTAALVSRPPETRTAERRADGTACGVLIFGVIPTAI